MIRTLTLALIGQKNAGRLDYLLKRRTDGAWGPLNGQKIRQQAYTELMNRIKFQAIVETGTYLGTSTEYFAQSGLPVYTVEIMPRTYGYASLRFRGRRDQIHVFQGDSPTFLRGLVGRANFPKSKVFFYLDAHGKFLGTYDKPPLLEELEIIFTNWTDAVVMIDDFQVPKSNYGFDDWGPGKTLNLEYLEPIGHLQLASFFPAQDAEHDAGQKRGWVVLCRDGAHQKVLERINALKPGRGITH